MTCSRFVFGDDKSGGEGGVQPDDGDEWVTPALSIFRLLSPRSTSLCFGGPVSERVDCLAEGMSAFGERVGAGVVSQGESGQYAGRFQFT